MPLGLGFNLQLDQPYGGSTFVPTSLSGCVLWLPPAMTSMFTDHLGASEVTLDGQVVGRWADASGVGNNATQSTAANKPLYKAGIQNSLPMVLFDGSNDALGCNGISSICSGDDKAFTVAIVWKKVSNTTNDCAFSVGAGSGIAPYARFHLKTDPSPYYNVTKEDDTGASTGGDSNPYTSNTTAHLVLMRNNGTTVDMWVDNTQIMTAKSCNTGLCTVTRGGIGAATISSTSFEAYFDGYIGEVVAWNRALTNTECGTVRTGLIGKWAL